MGRRSPEYLKYHNIGQHSYFSFDIDNDNNFYISHEIDSLIYKYDSNFKLLYTFGNEGKNIDKNYKEYFGFDIKEIRNLLFNERPKRGYYYKVCKIEDRDILFRSYKKGAKNLFDGLQIYKNECLIGDLEVPKGLTVIGYIEPYYYSSILSDELNMTMKLFRFKLINL